MLATAFVLTVGAGFFAIPTIRKAFEPTIPTPITQVANSNAGPRHANPASPNIKKEKPRRIWCAYEPKHEKLLIYLEAEGEKIKGSELGSASLVPVSETFEGSKPLAVACRTDGTIWWVSEEAAYNGTIVPREDGCCTIKDAVEIEHAKIPEYQVPGTKVMAAGILWPVGEQTPYIATITNTGYFQAFRAPLTGPTISENFLIGLESTRWPPTIARAVLGVLSANEFVLIPLGNKDSPLNSNITFFYYLQWRGSSYNDFSKTAIVRKIDIQKEFRPDLRTIFDVSPPIYDEDRGGWVSLFNGITSARKVVELDIGLKPIDVLEQERKAVESKKIEGK